MGEHNVNKNIDNRDKTVFIQHLLEDIQALDYLLENSQIEDDIIRIGSEQEICLLTEWGSPAFNSQEVLDSINDEHYTTELARYNIEINLDPMELTGDVFQKVENQLQELFAKAQSSAKQNKTHLLLTGILPTIATQHLDFKYMTPNPRYWALNDMIRARRGSDFELNIRGVDDLVFRHDSVLFEACNTSFQMHLQIEPHDFVSSYNWAMAISGPLLSVCTNSPLLFGRELWSETRIALFQQSIDTRNSTNALVDQQARVTFGGEWAVGNAADIFKKDIARYKIILTRELEQNALEEIAKGGAPKLQALNLFNSTVYRWNRACYGTGGGKAHLRIENRYIPSGPTRIDELANFVFWVGLMKGRPKQFDNMPSAMDFKVAKNNFVKAAQHGIETMLTWNDKLYSAKDLVVEVMLPIARKGLERMSIDIADIDKYLGIIEKRASAVTASQWITRHYRFLQKSMKKKDAIISLTRALYDYQNENTPVHEWDKPEQIKHHINGAHYINDIMSTRVFTIRDSDIADLATTIMKWHDIHHLPVEDQDKKLCGLLTWTHMKKREADAETLPETLVSSIMVKDVISLSPRDTIKDAIDIMKKNEIGCLPVVQNDQLVGIITIADIRPYLNG